MITVYTGETPPETFSKSLFLAGPSPRSDDDPNWRIEAIKLLEELGYDGVVFSPVWRDTPPEPFDYMRQVSWEKKYLNMADQIVFWVPRDLKSLPGFTTNVEFGLWVKSGKILLGSPSGTPKMDYLNWWAGEEGVSNFSSLKAILIRVIEKLSEGAERIGGEREVPLHLWLKSEFQTWFQAQREAGNRLDGAELVWAFRAGKNKSITVLWSLRVNVWVEVEKRAKTNEVVVFRPPTTSVIVFCRPPLSSENDWTLDSEIMLVREFRSPASTEDGMVHEVPGGSSWKEGAGIETARTELIEESGLELPTSRFRYVGARQVAATLCGHQAHVYAAELTVSEMLSMKWLGDTRFGNAEDTEITYVEVKTLREIVKERLVDWSNLGMIFQALGDGTPPSVELTDNSPPKA